MAVGQTEQCDAFLGYSTHTREKRALPVSLWPSGRHSESLPSPQPGSRLCGGTGPRPRPGSTPAALCSTTPPHRGGRRGCCLSESQRTPTAPVQHTPGCPQWTPLHVWAPAHPGDSGGWRTRGGRGGGGEVACSEGSVQL